MSESSQESSRSNKDGNRRVTAAYFSTEAQEEGWNTRTRCTREGEGGAPYGGKGEYRQIFGSKGTRLKAQRVILAAQQLADLRQGGIIIPPPHRQGNAQTPPGSRFQTSALALGAC